jgi:hypothetical protein
MAHLAGGGVRAPVAVGGVIPIEDGCCDPFGMCGCHNMGGLDDRCCEPLASPPLHTRAGLLLHNYSIGARMVVPYLQQLDQGPHIAHDLLAPFGPLTPTQAQLAMGDQLTAPQVRGPESMQSMVAAMQFICRVHAICTATSATRCTGL